MALKLETTARTYRRVYLYGSTKTCKTTTAASFPAPVIAQDAEMRGADFLAVPHLTIDTVQAFGQFAHDLPGEKAYQTVVLDDFGNMVRRWVAANSKGGGDPRAAYKATYAQVMPVLGKLMALPLHLVITGHVNKENELPANAVRERALVHPNLPDALETYVLGMFDVIGYCYNNGRPTALVVESATDARRIVAGCRVGLPFSTAAAKCNGMVALSNLAAEVCK